MQSFFIKIHFKKRKRFSETTKPNLASSDIILYLLMLTLILEPYTNFNQIRKQIQFTVTITIQFNRA